MASYTWAGSSGSWDTPSQWGGTVPGPFDVASISANGSYTVSIGSAGNGYTDAAAALILSDPGATVTSGAPAGQTARLRLSHDLVLSAGTLNLGSLYLQGGTVRLRGGSYLFGSRSVLDGVSWESGIDLSGSPAGTVLTVQDGLTLLQTGTSLPALNVASGDTVNASGTETLDAMTIQLAGGTLLAPQQPGAVLTLGLNARLNAQPGATIATGAQGVIANNGLIDVKGSPGNASSYTLSLTGGGELDNYGRIGIGYQATFSTGSATFVNAGGIALAGGALFLGANALQAGVITFSTGSDAVHFAAAEGYQATLYHFQAGDTLTFANGRAYGGLALNGQVLSVLDTFGNSMADLTISGAAPTLNQFTAGFGADGSVTVATSQAAPPVTDPDFDAAYYLAQNPDIAAAGLDPLVHYNTYGWHEGRNPNAWFNTTYYLARNPDVAAAGINPLQHFEVSGWKEGRDPSAQFSISRYLATNPDIANAHIDPLAHYLQYGQYENRTPYTVSATAPAQADALVDYAYYYTQHPDVLASGMDAATHYHTIGWKLGYDPDPYFDTKYYLTIRPDVAAAGVDPLQHFEQGGWKEGTDPSLAFSDSKYLAAYPDVANAGINPLVHYELSGVHEGRMTFLAGPTATGAPNPLIDAGYYFSQLATIVPTGVDASASYDQTGWHLGLNPDGFFDTKYYLANNPDVARAGIDPLAHYEASGWKEGRNPSALFSTTKYEQAYGVTTNPLLDYYQGGAAAGRVNIPV